MTKATKITSLPVSEILFQCLIQILVHDVTACGRGLKSGHAHNHNIMRSCYVRNAGLFSYRDVLPHSDCRGILVGFHICTAGDKSFAPVSVSLTSVNTYDKLSDTAPLHSSHRSFLSFSFQHNSNPQILNTAFCLRGLANQVTQ